ncbi:MIP/aquaporin family protein [Segnochrobactrum spirostomi]|uniref:Aquaporin n=1 Tax=Segnochrobactrum spirostomi TaxID=2608987 RepID=A0A6A7YA54_9HYPH|nr:aquaporin [Segnochrobactrum spirostomi]MQT14349.1 aquaporin [Segnochrobactrum spirostomi]
MKKAAAEFIGTFTLVLFGCGAAAMAGMGASSTAIDGLPIAFAFGFAFIAMAYGIGPISGCHLNPAVSFGVLMAGRMSAGEFVVYAISQVIGAIFGAAALYLILSGKGGGWAPAALGQNGWGGGYLGGYDLTSAFVFEVVATFLLLVAVLGITQSGNPTHVHGLSGLAIGLTLTAIHIVGINITGVSVNPARSLGPAIVGAGSNPLALNQVWLFVIAPLVGAAFAGLLFKSGVLTRDES